MSLGPSYERGIRPTVPNRAFCVHGAFCVTFVQNMGESNLFGLKDNLIVYISSETHSSIEKAAMISGIGSNNVRCIEVDDNFSMDVSSLKKQIKKDIFSSPLVAEEISQKRNRRRRCRRLNKTRMKKLKNTESTEFSDIISQKLSTL